MQPIWKQWSRVMFDNAVDTCPHSTQQPHLGHPVNLVRSIEPLRLQTQPDSSAREPYRKMIEKEYVPSVVFSEGDSLPSIEQAELLCHSYLTHFFSMWSFIQLRWNDENIRCVGFVETWIEWLSMANNFRRTIRYGEKRGKSGLVTKHQQYVALFPPTWPSGHIYSNILRPLSRIKNRNRYVEITSHRYFKITRQLRCQNRYSHMLWIFLPKTSS